MYTDCLQKHPRPETHSFQSNLALLLSSLVLLFIFIPNTSSACGSIYSPKVPWDNPSTVSETYDQEVILDCDNPFKANAGDLPGLAILMVEEVEVIDGGEVEIPETGTRSYRFSELGGGFYEPQIGWFLHTSRGYEFVNTGPSQPTRDDIETLAAEFFPVGTDIQSYVEVVVSKNYEAAVVEDMDLLYQFSAYVEQEYEPVFPLLLPGTYTLVVIDNPPMLNQATPKYFWQRLVARIVPTIWAAVPNGDVIYTSTFTLKAKPVTPVGASSVLFLPGIQASRLYKAGLLGTEDQLWEPNTNQNLRQLALTEAGVSVNDIYTKDVIDEILVPALGDNVYKSFLAMLDDLEEDAVIKDSIAFAYDWRFSVQDIVVSGTRYKNEIRSVVEAVEALAANSYTDKVTIVGHSNGGLLAKALLTELERLGKSDLVDKVIFVGTPQLGTPKAIGVLLHGLDQQKLGGLVIDDVTSREVSRTMPGVYGLLPSQRYFSESGESVISADSSSTTASIRAYGEITSLSALTEFALDTRNQRPDDVPINEPGTPNATMLQAMVAKREYFDDWIAPSGVEVYEIVGTGLATIKGIKYQKFPCVSASCLLDNYSYMKPYPLFTNDGDETVVALSAKGYRGEKVTGEVNLLDEAGLIGSPNKHADLTESPTVKEFIDSIIRVPYLNQTLEVPQDFVAVTRSYTIIGAHSPVEIGLMSGDGKRIGVLAGEFYDELAAAQYIEFGGSSYLIIPEETEYTVTVKGTATGVYSLTIDTLDGGDEQKTVYRYLGASTTMEMVATFTGSSTGFSTIKTDTNGDGVIDLEQTLAGAIVLPPVIDYTYADLTSVIQGFGLPRLLERVVLTQVGIAKQFATTQRPKLEQAVLKNLEQTFAFYRKKSFISEVEFVQAKMVIDYLIRQ